MKYFAATLHCGVLLNFHLSFILRIGVSLYKFSLGLKIKQGNFNNNSTLYYFLKNFLRLSGISNLLKILIAEAISYC